MESFRAAALSAELFHDSPDASGTVVWTGDVKGLAVFTKVEFLHAVARIEVAEQRLGRMVVRVGQKAQIRRVGECSFDQLPQALGRTWTKFSPTRNLARKSP